MSSNQINTKTIARVAAVQLLYQYTLYGLDEGLDVAIDKMIQFYQEERNKNSAISTLSKPIKIRLSISHFKLLVKLGIENIEQIDNLISTHLTNEWKITNLPTLLLALLRVSVGELLFCQETPTNVIVNEFTDIADEMLNDAEVGFVNSILDVIAKNNRKI